MVEAERVLDFDDLRTDRGEMDVVDVEDFVIGQAPAPIAVVTDNGPCLRGTVFADAFASDDPVLRHVRTRVRSPQNNVVERFFGTCFRRTYNTLRPHQALDDRTPRQAYLTQSGEPVATGPGVR